MPDGAYQKAERAGFRVENWRYGKVDNLWAVHGQDAPTLAFLGHTDVVPSGIEAQWCHPPFQPLASEGFLYGRGVADMKGAVAAMVVALERFCSGLPYASGASGITVDQR